MSLDKLVDLEIHDHYKVFQSVVESFEINLLFTSKARSLAFLIFP